MITQIKNIERGGIFQNYTPQALDDFNRYNLIYGWNGSGKSTLAKILRHLETREAILHLEQLTYKIDVSGQTLTESTETVDDVIRVFNPDFIKGHLSFETGDAQSIVYIGKEKVELKEKITKKTEQIATSLQIVSDTKKKIAKLTDDKNKWFTAVGGDLSRFHSTTVFAADAKNITKVHAEQNWKVIRQGDSLEQFILGDTKFNELYAFIQQSSSRKKFAKIDQEVDQKYFEDAYKKFQSLLNANPVISTIERLRDNPTIQEWVQWGLNLHKEHTSLKCEYCRQDIPAARQKELEAHFNEQFKQLQNEITDFIKELKTKYVRPQEYNVSDVPQGHENNFNMHYSLYIECLQELNTGLDKWIQKLEHKLANPLERSFSTSNIVVHSFGMSKQWINGFADWHNKNIDDFEAVSKKYKTEIDLHIVASKARDDNFMGLLQEIEVTDEASKTTVADHEKLKQELKVMQTELEDDTLVIEEFNTDLHKFMQRNEIVLAKKAQGGGYVLERGGNPAKNLSEGEKSAISLVYFMKKLTEGSNTIENTIVIFDDPISSFDSNHLFAASSYIMSNCKKAKQLFILTHSFWFFKLIRDWYKKRCKDKYALYSLTRAGLRKAEPALANHHSEYHYIFTNVKKWADSNDIDWQDNFLIANHCRRLLESFNAFKTPSHEGFNDILQRAENKGFSADIINKLVFFLNKYSHLDRIEAHENAVENIQGEGKNVAVDTLKIIEFLDKEHHDALAKLCAEN